MEKHARTHKLPVDGSFKALRAGVVAATMALAGYGQLVACGSVPATGVDAFTSVPLDANTGTGLVTTGNVDTPNATTPNATTPNTVLAPDQGIALVWSRNVNQCLGSSTPTIVAGAPIVQVACTGAATQQWTWVNGTFRIGSWCMTSTAANAALVFQTCVAGNGNQSIYHNYGKLVSKLGIPAPVGQVDGTTQLVNSAGDSSEDANQRVYLLQSTPLSRGFVIRNNAVANRCLAIQAAKTVVLPCVGTDANQRWHFTNGFLRNLGSNLCLSHNTAAGPLGTVTCANANGQADDFWLGGSSDLPGHVTVASGNFPMLVWDPNAADANAVQFMASGLPGRIWSMGRAAPY